ncbi:hypothetical protein EWM64_g10500 [Hericium alpestre]|uniref:Uncharacterized protein n=1 Tax=Hericium alpestre TaxID=135208 RepID=A0A4Y9ZI60_9AGAM|nr:hypothetical protein EWM64_g10500 [Hericium alpestre]
MTATPAAKIPPDSNGAAMLAALVAEADVDATDAELEDTRDDIDAATEERCDEADEVTDSTTDDAEDASEDRTEDIETAAELRADVADASEVVDGDRLDSTLDATEATKAYALAGVPAGGTGQGVAPGTLHRTAALRMDAHENGGRGENSEEGEGVHKHR